MMTSQKLNLLNYRIDGWASERTKNAHLPIICVLLQFTGEILATVMLQLLHNLTNILEIVTVLKFLSENCTNRLILGKWRFLSCSFLKPENIRHIQSLTVLLTVFDCNYLYPVEIMCHLYLTPRLSLLTKQLMYVFFGS